MGEEKSEVHSRGPLSGISLDVELTAGTVYLADNGLDRHGGSLGGFLVFVEL